VGGDNVAISLLHIRLETLISSDKRALDKFRPLYGVFILSSHGYTHGLSPFSISYSAGRLPQSLFVIASDRRERGNLVVFNAL
jgi:hypothetical protein